MADGIPLRKATMMKTCFPMFSSFLSRSLLHRHWHAWNLHIDRQETASGSEVKRSPVIAAKGDVRGGGMSMDDAAEFPSSRINDVKTAGPAAVDIALSVDFHAVGHARLCATEVDEHAAAVLRCRPIRQDLVCPYMATPRVSNIK